MLAPAVHAIGSAAGTDSSLAVTVLISAGGDAAVEVALDSLPAEYSADTAIDMHGPLPPLGFAAVRFATTDSAAIRAAWHALDLPHHADGQILHRLWRRRAAAAHPDRQPATSDHSVAELTAA